MLRAGLFAGTAALVIFVILSIRANKLVAVSRFRNVFVFTFLAGLIVLVTYRFSYWGDKGLGEIVRVPIGYGQAIENMDGRYTYFFPKPEDTDPEHDGFKIAIYYVEGKKLYAEADARFSEIPTPEYIEYDIERRTMRTLGSRVDYDALAQKGKVPGREKFYDIVGHYNRYWHRIPFYRRWVQL